MSKGETVKTLFYWVLYPLTRPFYLVFLILNTLILALVIITLSLIDSRGNLTHYIGKFWSLFNLHLSGTRLTVRGTEKIERGKPYIVMSNHQSLLDVWALIGRIPLQLRWIVKIELRKIPAFGYALERMGHIYIDRDNRKNTYDGLAVAAERIKGGTSVIIFPEGTRSRDGRLQRFKKGGAFLAIQSGVSILPVTINGGRFALPKGTMALMPGKMEIIVGDPIDPGKYSQEDQVKLMNDVKSAIEKNLDLCYGSLV